MSWCSDCCEIKCTCTEEEKNRHNCLKCNVKMENHTISMPPLRVGQDWDKVDIQLEIRICPGCYMWEPCDRRGETHASRSKKHP